MQHVSFNAMPCPITGGLDRVDEWWSIPILSRAFRGRTQFSRFRKSLGIAPNILSQRLRGMVEAGLLEKVRYNMANGQERALVDAATGLEADPVMMDGDDGKRLDRAGLRSAVRLNRHERHRRQA